MEASLLRYIFLSEEESYGDWMQKKIFVFIFGTVLFLCKPENLENKPKNIFFFKL